jgi:hypothetical protein
MELKSSTREMLDSVNAELKRLEDRRRVLSDRKATLEIWLAEEEPQATLPGIKIIHGVPADMAPPLALAGPVREIMSDGRARANSDVEAALRERKLLPTDGKLDGRKINAIMLGLMNRGEVIRKNDKWVKK